MNFTKNALWSCLAAFLIFACKTQSGDVMTKNLKDPNQVVKEYFPDFYKEGHRGARGLMPENTIPSMKQAIDDGANIIELDIHISKDNKVLVAHDPFINPQYSLLPNGKELSEEDARNYVLYQMNYENIRKFDVGLKYHSGFPEQTKIPAYIPLFGELIDSVEQYIDENGLPDVIYNIEIKSKPEQDGYYQPEPETLIRLVMQVVNDKQLPNNRFYIQSFDIRQIQEVNKNYPYVVTGFLTSNKDLSLEENLQNIGFKPQIYSPNYGLATAELIYKSHEHGMKFVPWTVNTLDEMKRLTELGVDGIITDYPHLLNELKLKN